MNKHFQSILNSFFQGPEGAESPALLDPSQHLKVTPKNSHETAKSLVAAFLVTITGEKHPLYKNAHSLLDQLESTAEWGNVVLFLNNGLNEVLQEIDALCDKDPEFNSRLEHLAEWLAQKVRKQVHNESPDKLVEKIWGLFFPEASGIEPDRGKSVESLRKKRIVTISEPNNYPLSNPAKELLVTSNILLTVPPGSKDLKDLPIDENTREKLPDIQQETQLYWYDHPIEIGVKPENNEILYGLNGLQTALDFERKTGSISKNTRLKCLLSVSVTHEGLHNIAKPYIEQEIKKSKGFEGLDVFVFTENDSDTLIKKVLVPAAKNYLGIDNAEQFLSVFGVDGEYGRHYSFLKSIAALWNISIDRKIRGTFKIDLDQVFPQKELVDQTGASAFEHFKTPLWGASGTDSEGNNLELGMIAGALVNEKDISKSIFHPDVSFPDHKPAVDEHIFFSALPQALSTEGEMGARYSSDELDGKSKCIQRVHVTGGTNGILIDSLFRYRPFTPSFMGRAEDQAYIMSVLNKPGIRLAYLHKDGLIMRHDKEVFAQEAIESSHISKLIGDYIRILYFSAYARTLSNSPENLKSLLDPFTGCFISHIPLTVVYFRFCLKAASFFNDGNAVQGEEFIKLGSKRISDAIDFSYGKSSELVKTYKKEKYGWDLFYDTLSALGRALDNQDPFALDLKEKAETIIRGCKVGK